MASCARTVLKRPLTRRIGRLVVTISADGIRFRGKHRRSWRMVTWEQVASLASADAPLIAVEERTRGQRELRAIGAIEE
jgi:hypothetical protein